MDNIYKPPISNLTDSKKTRFPWTFVFRWLILIISVLSLFLSLWMIIEFWEILQAKRAFFVFGMQVMLVVSGWLLLKRRKIALPLFTIHLLISYVETVKNAPHLIGSAPVIAGWIFSLLAIFLCVYLLQRGELR